MKVLQVLSSLNKGAGVSNIVMSYYRNFNIDAVQCDFLCFSKVENSYEDEVIRLGGQVFYFNKPSLKKYRVCKARLIEFFKENGGKYDVLHCHEIMVANLIFPIAKRYGVKKCILHVHSAKYSDSRLKAARNRIISFGATAKSDFNFACSKEVGRVYFKRQVENPEKFKVVYNAIESEKYAFNGESRERYRTEFDLGDNFIIGHVGRFSKEKNHKFLIDVFAGVIKNMPESRLLLVGDGPLKNEIIDYVKEKGLQDFVVFTGVRKDVAGILNAMDVLTLPSIFEGVPITVIEGQFNGLNCVISKNISRDVQISETVFFVDVSHGVKDWKDKILLLSQKGRVNPLSDESRNYNIKFAARRLQDIYSEIK